MVLIFYYMLVTTAEKRKYYSWVFEFNPVELQTTFARAQSAILQSRDFNFRVGSALYIAYTRSYNLKN